MQMGKLIRNMKTTDTLQYNTPKEYLSERSNTNARTFIKCYCQ